MQMIFFIKFRVVHHGAILYTQITKYAKFCSCTNKNENMTLHIEYAHLSACTYLSCIINKSHGKCKLFSC